jgi:hypothetical protein
MPKKQAQPGSRSLGSSEPLMPQDGSYRFNLAASIHARAEFRPDRVLNCVEEPKGEGKKGGGHVEQPRGRVDRLK